MKLPQALRTVAGRLETFLTAHQLVKRRPSATRKGPASLTWPHESPNAEELAFAGFYYKPTVINPDNVVCCVCNCQLDGWDPADNPAFEHLTHSPECGLAINACIRLRNGDPNRVEEDPFSPKMDKARRDTFLDCWPHEGKRGWLCTVDKMVSAGFYYDPTPECEDGVTCAYCGLSLDGWEPKDNPTDEHKRRNPECYFFTLTSIHAKTKRPSKRASSRASRLSKTSIASTESEPAVRKSTKRKSVAEQAPVKRTKLTISKTTRIRKQSSPPPHPQTPPTAPKTVVQSPWKPTDLESVFADATFTALSIDPNTDMIKQVKALISSPEMQMTVEEWIYHNARRSEQKLREECERLVATFESEGSRALKALESIQCVD